MTFTHTSFRQEMDEIFKEIKELSQNIYIEKFVTKPEIPTLQLQLLNLFFHDAAVPRSLRKPYCVTAGLIQMGLDLHESISVQSVFQEKEVRKRQLSILAGDYYSSKFYSLLSKHQLIDGVKRLALAIKNINVAKMKLYTLNNDADVTRVDEVLKLFKEKESNLYIQFLDQHISNQRKSLWHHIIGDMIVLFTLLGEFQQQKLHFDRYHFNFNLVNLYANYNEKVEIQHALYTELRNKIKNLYHKYDIQGKTEQIMQNIFISLKGSINEIEHPTIRGELDLLLEQYETMFHTPMNIVEEV